LRRSLALASAVDREWCVAHVVRVGRYRGEAYSATSAVPTLAARWPRGFPCHVAAAAATVG